MSFSLQAIVGTTTYNLSDGAPFSLEDATGLAMPSVVRYEQTSPYQHGATDLGYNLQPRVMTLALSFVAATDAILDGYRDDLNGIFKPSNGQAVQLRVTRDDDAVRQIDVYATAAAIEIERTHRPGHLHKAVVQLRAADPIWYDPSPGTATLTLPGSDWYLAGGLIGTAQVLEHVDMPTPDQAWTWAGSFGGTTSGNLLIVWRMTGAIPEGGTAANYSYAWQSGTAGNTPFAFAATDSNGPEDYLVGRPPFYVRNGLFHGTITSGVVYGVTYTRYPDSNFYMMRLNSSESEGDISADYGIADTLTGSGHWGGNGGGTATRWPGTITHAAIYYPVSVFNHSLVAAIQYAIDAGSVTNRDVIVEYAGDAIEYPIITLTGPVSDPIITNQSTEETLDFSGVTIPNGVTYTIDLRSEALSVIDSGGTVRTQQLTDDSALGTWAIMPDPIASNGQNLITLSGTAFGTATAVRVVYYNRYLGY